MGKKKYALGAEILHKVRLANPGQDIWKEKTSQQGQMLMKSSSSLAVHGLVASPDGAGLRPLSTVHRLHKLRKIDAVLGFYGLVMTANFPSPDIVSEPMYSCSFIFTSL